MKTSRYALTALLLIVALSAMALAVAPTVLARQNATATPVATAAPTESAAGTATTAVTTTTPSETATPEASGVVTSTTTTTQTLSASQATIVDLQAAVEQVYQQAAASVVSVRTVALIQSQFGNQSPDNPFGFGPDMPGQGSPQLAQGLGSGFVWDDQGHIVTNNHVVEGAQQLTVVFNDGVSLAAKVVGTDPESDLAVIQIDPTKATNLRPINVANSTDVRVGQFVVAIGNPFGLDATMTFGIVSALGRTIPVSGATSSSSLAPTYTIPDIIQTDAPVNPGNSGGALLDLQGRLIGVPSAIESPVRASAGVGFAIPSVIVQKVVPALISTGSFQHPYLGISGTTMTPQLAAAMNLPETQRGALVVDVTSNSPADKAGLQGSTKQADIEGAQVPVGGDVITAIDGQPVRNFEDLTTYLARNGSVGQDITLTVLRDGKEQTLTVTLGARPSSQQSARNQQPQQTTARAWLGINGLTLTPDLADAMNLQTDQQGVLILNVVNGSPADDAGLRGGFRAMNLNGQRIPVGGDIIVAVNGKPVDSVQSLAQTIGSMNPGDQVTLTVLRNGEQTDVTATLGEPPTQQP